MVEAAFDVVCVVLDAEVVGVDVAGVVDAADVPVLDGSGLTLFEEHPLTATATAADRATRTRLGRRRTSTPMIGFDRTTALGHRLQGPKIP